MLTGVRGIGKTTTARIIARALNCVGPDGTGGPTIEPCGQCDHCRSIAEDRHVDVMEVDAASHTGVDNIRELTDGARYLPVSARYKIYIIDEVHMLSQGRVQRAAEDAGRAAGACEVHLRHHGDPQGAGHRAVALPALRSAPRAGGPPDRTFPRHRRARKRCRSRTRRWPSIARAADGSVRDGLSLLDQAMALGEGGVTAAQVRDMLGLADRTQIFDLFGKVMAGEIADALDSSRKCTRTAPTRSW